MRVLFIAHAFPRYAGDSAGSFLHRLARALQDVGAAVRVVAPGGPGLAAEEDVAGVRVVRYRYAPRSFETLAYTGTMAEAVGAGWGGRLALGGLLASAAARVARESRRWQPDVVHAHWWFPGGASASVPGVRGRAPLVVTLHGSDVRLARAIAPARAAFSAVARRAAAVTAVSRWLCTEAGAMAPGLRCQVARMPVAAELFAPPAAGVARAGVLFVGRLTAQKGVDVLLRALAQTRHSPRLTVVGSGPDESSLRRLADGLGLAERVRWVPSQPQAVLATYYREARVLAVPSTDEGLGLVAVEAALCGTPAVGFASGGLPDVIGDGQTGRLIAPGDVAALARALDDVTADAGYALALGAAAAERAAEFVPSTAAHRYLSIYAAAVRGRTGGAA